MMSQYREQGCDAGPWVVAVDNKTKQVWLQSEDFTHDVSLAINGDFGDFETRRAYAERLAQILTKGCALDRALEATTAEDDLLPALNKALEGPGASLLGAAAQEIAQLRNALSEAHARMEKLEANAYFRERVANAAEPSPFALALCAALGRRQAP